MGIFLVSLAITVLQFWSASETQRSVNSLSNRIDDNIICDTICQSNRQKIDSDNNTTKHNLIGYWIVLCLYVVCVLLVSTLIMFSISIFAVLKKNPTKPEQLLLLAIYTFLITIFQGTMIGCIVTVFTNVNKNYAEVPDATISDMNRVFRYSGICFGITDGHCVLALIATIVFLVMRRKYMQVV